MMEETRKRNRPLKKGVSRNEKAAAPTSSTANPKGIREQVSETNHRTEVAWWHLTGIYKITVGYLTWLECCNGWM